MGLIVFNGKSSEEFGLKVATNPGHEFPEREYEITHVPGRNGDISEDLGSFKNVTRSYSMSAGSEDGVFEEYAQKFLHFLRCSGYSRLEDSYEPDVYRKALFHKAGSITNIYGHAAQLKVEFDCAPQRFLKKGDLFTPVDIETYTGTTITNPTGYTAKPIIRIKPQNDLYGACYGKFYVNDIPIEYSFNGGTSGGDLTMLRPRIDKTPGFGDDVVIARVLRETAMRSVPTPYDNTLYFEITAEDRVGNEVTFQKSEFVPKGTILGAKPITFSCLEAITDAFAKEYGSISPQVTITDVQLLGEHQYAARGTNNELHFDCESGEAVLSYVENGVIHKDNANDSITIGDVFPEFGEGESNIRRETMANTSEIAYAPRWWRL